MGNGRWTASTGWRKSSFCASGACVEVQLVNGDIAVRDSKDPTKPPHLYSADEWANFVAGVKNGEFDLPSFSNQPGH